MRRRYLVTYDISDPRRLRKVFKKMCGFGEHLQLSVFLCSLAEIDLARMFGELGDLIHHEEDQVLTIDLGPDPGFGSPKKRIRSIGRAFVPRERSAVII